MQFKPFALIVCFSGALLMLCLRGSAQEAPPPPPAEAKPTAVLPDRPDAHVNSVDTAPDIALGPVFQSLAAGISLRPPVGMKLIKRPISGEEVVQFLDEPRQ